MNLTDEQLLAASKAMVASNPQSKRWQDIDSFEKQIYLGHALAAAPFLQAWWVSPSHEEIAMGQDDCEESGYPAHDRAVSYVLCRFVNRRNAALIPKMVDPRREKVEQAIESIKDYHRAQSLGAPPLGTGQVADRILAALDAKE